MGAIPKADRQRQLSARASALVRTFDRGAVGRRILIWKQAAQLARLHRPPRPQKRLVYDASSDCDGLRPNFREAKKLAKILARCKRRRRCMSGACPECGRAFQRFFVCEVSKLATSTSQRELASISIAFPKHRAAEDKLKALRPQA